MVLEKTIVAGILRTLNSIDGVYARKTHGGAYSTGWPDIVASVRGRCFMLEVKRPGGRATPLQRRELDRWSAAGAVALVVTSVDEVRAALDLE